ncbi:M16 family metallopeptidase [Paenibacillus sp. FSL K6-1230]|uniref:M16 family metallopeptidase n=1 Tax=Paenibacillus sp. FSL K6-1230 TaxID=2921603 RepID=UPI0030F5F2C5
MRDRIQKHMLVNGSTCLIRETDVQVERVVLCLAVRAGSLLESEQRNGLAHLVEHMNMNFDKFALHPSTLSHTSYGYTDFDRTVYVIELSNDWTSIEQGLVILRNIALGTYLDSAFFSAVKEEVMDEITALSSRRPSLVYRHIFEQSPLQARMPIGNLSHVKQLDFEKVVEFHRSWYVPENLSVIAVGDLCTAKFQKQVQRYFDLPQGKYMPELSFKIMNEFELKPFNGVEVKLPQMGEIGIMDIYIKQIRSYQMTLKSKCVSELIALCLDIALGSDMVAHTSYINFLNRYDLWKTTLFSDRGMKNDRILERMLEKIKYAVVDRGCHDVFMSAQQNLLSHFTNLEFIESMTQADLLDECLDHVMMASPLLSYETEMNLLIETIEGIRLSDVETMLRILHCTSDKIIFTS